MFPQQINESVRESAIGCHKGTPEFHIGQIVHYYPTNGDSAQPCAFELLFNCLQDVTRFYISSWDSHDMNPARLSSELPFKGIVNRLQLMSSGKFSFFVCDQHRDLSIVAGIWISEGEIGAEKKTHRYCTFPDTSRALENNHIPRKQTALTKEPVEN